MAMQIMKRRQNNDIKAVKMKIPRLSAPKSAQQVELPANTPFINLKDAG